MAIFKHHVESNNMGTTQFRPILSKKHPTDTSRALTRGSHHPSSSYFQRPQAYPLRTTTTIVVLKSGWFKLPTMLGEPPFTPARIFCSQPPLHRWIYHHIIRMIQLNQRSQDLQGPSIDRSRCYHAMRLAALSQSTIVVNITSWRRHHSLITRSS